MMLPDVNVLIAAFRADSPHHGPCRAWLDDIVKRDRPFGLSRLALSAVVRVVSNPRAFRIPSMVDEAFGFCEDLLGQPHCRLVEPGEAHWSIFRRLCVDSGIRGARVSDAWFAALAIESGCQWITLDRDFARFSDLHWSTPLRS